MTVNRQRDICRATYLLRCCHATALSADKGRYETLAVLHHESPQINLSDDGHVMIIKRRVNGPIRCLATYLHHNPERLEDLVIALQTDCDVVVGDGHKRIDGKAQCLGLERLYIIRTATADEAQPVRHVRYGVVLDLSAQVLDIHVEGIVFPVFLVDIDGVFRPLERVLLHVCGPLDGVGHVAVQVVYLGESDIERRTFYIARVDFRLRQVDHHFALRCHRYGGDTCLGWCVLDGRCIQYQHGLNRYRITGITSVGLRRHVLHRCAFGLDTVDDGVFLERIVSDQSAAVHIRCVDGVVHIG